MRGLNASSKYVSDPHGTRCLDQRQDDEETVGSEEDVDPRVVCVAGTAGCEQKVCVRVLLDHELGMDLWDH
jgi:hypothetical protein